MLIPVGTPGTLTEAIARQLIQLIMNGDYRPGQKLPSEFELGLKFKAGRGVVREAITALSLIGLVRVVRGKGTFVNSRDRFLIHPLSMGVKVDAKLHQVVEARKLIEVELAGLAAERASPEQIQSIETFLDRMEESIKPEQSEQYLEADVGFHFSIAAAADNYILSQFITLTRNLMHQWISDSLSVPGSAEDSFGQHRRIFAAIHRHKPKMARKAMERHLTVMGDRFLLAEKSKIDLSLKQKAPRKFVHRKRGGACI